MHHASTVAWRITARYFQTSSTLSLNSRPFACTSDAWSWSALAFGATPSQRTRLASSISQVTWLSRSSPESAAKNHASATVHMSCLTLAAPSSCLTRNSVKKSALGRHKYATEANQFGRLTEKEYRRHPNKFYPLSGEGIHHALGSGVTRELGNALLETLQKQRITGTLDHPIAHEGVDANLVGKALLWLRANYAVDEEEAIIKRIEFEEHQLESQFVADAERFKTYRPQERAKEEGIYGKSQLEAIRKENEEKAGVEKQADEVRNAAADSTIIQHPRGRAVLARRTESVEWVKKYKKKAALSDLLEPEKISKTKRLLPSAIFTIVVVGLCAVFAHNYRPPERKARIWPDVPPAAATALTLISLNVIAFFMWRVPFFWRFMNQNFLLIPATPRISSLLGNTFSHHSLFHLAMNMVFLWFIGTKLHDQIGRGNFLALYLSCGVFASFVSLSRFILTNSLLQTSLGASGAMSGIVAAWLTFNSSEQFTIAFLPESISPKFSSNFALACLLTVEILGAFRGITRIDHWAHLGGYTAGILGVNVLNSIKEKRIPVEKEQRRKLDWYGESG